MKFLVKATIPIEAGNALAKDPNFQKRLDSIMGDIRPEAAYFAVESGQRTVFFVVTIADASELPRVAEPLWLSLRADVEFVPVMVQADFAKAMPHIQAAAKKY
jgi:hypothetical protein